MKAEARISIEHSRKKVGRARCFGTTFTHSRRSAQGEKRSGRHLAKAGKGDLLFGVDMKTAWKIVRNAVDQFINEFSRFFARIHVHRSSGKDAADRLTVPLIANGIRRAEICYAESAWEVGFGHRESRGTGFGFQQRSHIAASARGCSPNRSPGIREAGGKDVKT